MLYFSPILWKVPPLIFLWQPVLEEWNQLFISFYSFFLAATTVLSSCSWKNQEMMTQSYQWIYYGNHSCQFHTFNINVLLHKYNNSFVCHCNSIFWNMFFTIHNVLFWCIYVLVPLEQTVPYCRKIFCILSPKIISLPPSMFTHFDQIS